MVNSDEEGAMRDSRNKRVLIAIKDVPKEQSEQKGYKVTKTEG